MGLANLRREYRVSGGLDSSALWLTDDFRKILSGVTVSQASAMCQTAIFDAVRVIADPISVFPVDALTKSGAAAVPLEPTPPWVDQPEPDPAVARSDHYQALMVSLLLNGNYYGRVLTDARSEPLSVAVLDPTTVEPQKNPRTGLVEYVVRGAGRPLTSQEIIHVTELRKPGAIKGTSRIDELRETFGIGKALDEYVARYFSQGTLSSVVVESPEPLTDVQRADLKETFESRTKGLRNAHRPITISGGGKISRLGDNAEQAQMTEARDFFVLEVARAFKIPPSKLAVNTPGTRAYASIEQDNIDFVTGTLQFYVAKIEEAYSRLLAPRRGFLKFNMNSLLRGDTGTRYGAYSQALDAGWIVTNEVRAKEDLPPIPGGDELRVPLENISLGAANLVELDKRVAILTSLIASGADPASAAATVGLPLIEFPRRSATASAPEPTPTAA